MGLEALLLGALIVLVLFGLLKFIPRKKEQNLQYVINFETYIGVQSLFIEKAYDIIHKDRMLIYSIEATKIDDKQFNEFAKDFASLVIKLMGPMLTNEFTNLYGDEDTFLFNLMEVFSTKYESDEIRKDAIENLMETGE